MSYSARLNVCLISSNAVNSEERGGETQTCHVGLMSKMEEKGESTAEPLCLCQVFRFVAWGVLTELCCVSKGCHSPLSPSPHFSWSQVGPLPLPLPLEAHNALLHT